MLTEQDLKDVEAAYRAASTVAEQKREERNQLVLKAIEADWTHARISQATGLTRARVGQIALMR